MHELARDEKAYGVLRREFLEGMRDFGGAVGMEGGAARTAGSLNAEGLTEVLPAIESEARQLALPVVNAQPEIARRSRILRPLGPASVLTLLIGMVLPGVGAAPVYAVLGAVLIAVALAAAVAWGVMRTRLATKKATLHESLEREGVDAARRAYLAMPD